jgi:hypothetical protein
MLSNVGTNMSEIGAQGEYPAIEIHAMETHGGRDGEARTG